MLRASVTRPTVRGAGFPTEGVELTGAPFATQAPWGPTKEGASHAAHLQVRTPCRSEKVWQAEGGARPWPRSLAAPVCSQEGAHGGGNVKPPKGLPSSGLRVGCEAHAEGRLRPPSPLGATRWVGSAGFPSSGSASQPQEELYSKAAAHPQRGAHPGTSHTA